MNPWQVYGVVGMLWLVGGQATANPTAGKPGTDDLVIADQGKTTAVVVVASTAGPWEKRAAADLAHYIQKMTGARPTIADNGKPLAAKAPLLIVGHKALELDPTLKTALEKVVKKAPVLRGDGIVIRRRGNRVFLAGANDDCHYYAVAELLRRWGCRWYLPTDIGECIPTHKTLSVGDIDLAYAPPFEVRNYWIAWNGSNAGQQEFTRRNFMNYGVGVPSGHAIGAYVQELIPKGKTVYNVPISDPKTADHIAKKIEAKFAAGEDISLGMEDGIYESEFSRDRELQANFQDKYFLVPSLTDPFMELYNGVAGRLARKYPQSKAKIGFLAYSNITLPPQRDLVAAKPLVAYLAPIDIDPNHGMDDPRSPTRQEYKEVMYRWAKVMQGRVVIYDYDQGMLVWRDIPNPSIASIPHDIKHYRKAGILGVSTESRGAMATILLNLFIRGQLYWNPDADVDALLAEFYEKFYGPAAKPMASYWTAIFKAWDQTPVTEHEYFVIPAIYTRELVESLEKHLAEAEKLVPPGDAMVAARVNFARLGYGVLKEYTAMARAAATEADYAAAVSAGERGLAARKQLAAMNPTFTTRVSGVAEETAQGGPAWWPGEVAQYRDLLQFTNGAKGTLILKMPLEWAYRRDPNDTGLPSGWAYKPVDLTYWQGLKDAASFASHQHNPGHWEMVRTDLYLQAQGVVQPDYHYVHGYGWYRAGMELKPADAAGKAHLRFPGLFNECWLYVNGALVAHREQKAMWWYNDYKFEWDVDLTGKVKAGRNEIALRIYNPHHFGGMFRRAFVYRPARK